MSKSSNATQSLGNSSSVGDLFGSLMGGDGIDMNDVLDSARKFFSSVSGRNFLIGPIGCSGYLHHQSLKS